MRPIRVFMTTAPLFLAACGIVAGLDGYELDQNVAAGTDASGSEQKDGRAPASDAGGTNNPTDSGNATADAGADTGVQMLVDGGLEHDAGMPMYDASCTALSNGKSCARDAAACCSSKCDETDTCTNSCNGAVGDNCNNGNIGVGATYAIGEGNCCVNLFCNPNGSDVYPFVNDPGKCAPCLATGQKPPVGTFHEIGRDVPIYYDDACCSRQTDMSGNCK
jgi:hypothetical protein